jgi:hypothetical protein
MPQPKVTSQWPPAGDLRTVCELQYAVPVEDEMGGRGQPTWTTFTTWKARTMNVPGMGTDTGPKASWQFEGRYHPNIWRYFHGLDRPLGVGSGEQVSLRVLAMGLTLQVFDVENPNGLNRGLVVHCAKAINA